MDKELKPCPFCGSKKIEMKQYCKDGFIIKCKGCIVQRKQRTILYGLDWLENKMIEHWNNRASPPQSDNKRGAISLRNQWKAAHENDKFYVIDKLITDTIIFLGKLS